MMLEGPHCYQLVLIFHTEGIDISLIAESSFGNILITFSRHLNPQFILSN